MRKIDFSAHAVGRVHSVPKSQILKDLSTVPKVWLRVHRVRRGLEAPYCGSFEVINRHDKYLVLKLPLGDTFVSIDRLKPAVIPNVDTRPELRHQVSIRNGVSVASQSSSEVSGQLPEVEQVPERTSRLGCTVRFKAIPDFTYF